MKDKSQRKDLSMDNVLEAIIWYYGLDSISLAKGYYFDMDDEARANVLDIYRKHKKSRS